MSGFNNNIIDTLERRRKELVGFGVKKIGLFGSAARGEMTNDSDLDFIVHLENKSFDSYMGLKLFLEELFGRKVDLVIEETVKPRLKSAIEKETVYAEGYYGLLGRYRRSW